MAAEHEVLANRLNAEPAIFRGCSSSELGVIVGVSALIWLPASIALAALAGAPAMGFGIAAVAIVASVLLVSLVFQQLKRNRPDGYYQQHVLLWLDQRGLGRAPFVWRSGVWDIGRTTHATLPSRDR